MRVGFGDDGTILGLEVEFWHDTGAYTPYGIVLPIITATQLPGPYRHRHYRVTFTSLYTNTVTCTPYRGAGRPQGCFVMERTIDRIAEQLGLDRADVRARNLIGLHTVSLDVAGERIRLQARTTVRICNRPTAWGSSTSH